MNTTAFTLLATLGIFAGACSSDDDPQVPAPSSSAGTGNASVLGAAGSGSADGRNPSGNAAGAASVNGSMQTAATGSLRLYDVVATFREPKTQPNDTIFTGTFNYDPALGVVSNLVGSLTQSMTKVNGVFGSPMTTVWLGNQLSSVSVSSEGVDGLLVTSFALATTDTFAGGGFAPGGTQYYGLQEGTPSNHNAYITIFVNTRDPASPPDQSQIDRLAYADCTPGGMMMSSCMTGTTEAGYGRTGTMGGYPVSQVITLR